MLSLLLVGAAFFFFAIVVCLLDDVHDWTVKEEIETANKLFAETGRLKPKPKVVGPAVSPKPMTRVPIVYDV